MPPRIALLAGLIAATFAGIAQAQARTDSTYQNLLMESIKS